MKNNSIIRNILIVVIIVDIAVISVYGFLFYKIKTTIESSGTLVSNLELIQNRDKRFAEIQKTIQNIEERVGQLDSFVLKENNLITFLKLMETIASEQNLELKTQIKRIEVSREKKDAVELQITYNFTGSFTSGMNFIALVENLPYSTTVDSVSLQKTKTGEDEASLWSGGVTFRISAL